MEKHSDVAVAVLIVLFAVFAGCTVFFQDRAQNHSAEASR